MASKDYDIRDSLTAFGSVSSVCVCVCVVCVCTVSAANSVWV